MGGGIEGPVSGSACRGKRVRKTSPTEELSPPTRSDRRREPGFLPSWQFSCGEHVHQSEERSRCSQEDGLALGVSSAAAAPMMSTIEQTFTSHVENCTNARIEDAKFHGSRRSEVEQAHGVEENPVKALQPKEIERFRTTYVSPTTSSKHPMKAEEKAFKLMEIQNDNQDFSFVEKVLLSQNEIVRLCNAVMRGSATESEGRRIIEFEQLNSRSMKVVGFFGDKEMMRYVFQNTSLPEQQNFWEMILNDTLTPGLYASLHSKCLIVFYWHEGYSLPAATRKDMSCNFIRYLFDLCNVVNVCLDNKTLQPALKATVPKFAKRHRTQRLQISLVKASEDSVEMTEGFAVKNIQVGGATRVGSGHQLAESNEQRQYKLSEGRSRLALFATYTRPRKLSSIRENKEVPVKSFPDLFREWNLEYNINLSEISDSDFVSFIHCAGLPRAEDFQRLLHSHEALRTEEKKKKYHVDHLVAVQENLLFESITDFVNCYLKYKYPWEEMQHRNLNVAHNSSEDQLHSMRLDMDADSWGKLPGESRAKPNYQFNRMELDVYSHLFGNSSQQRLVFSNTEIHLMTHETNVAERKKRKRPVYTIEHAGDGGSFAPLLCGQHFVFRPQGMKTKGTPELVKVQRCAAPDYEGPILSHEELWCTDKSGHRKKVELAPVSREGGLYKWVDTVAHLNVPHFLNTASMLSTIYEELDEFGRKELTEEAVQRILLATDPLPVLLQFLPRSLRGSAKQKWTQSLSPEISQKPVTEAVRSVCIDVYGSARDAFVGSILGMIRRYSGGILSTRFRNQCQEGCERLDERLKIEVATYLSSLKAEISGVETRPLTLTVESCRILDKSGVSNWTLKLNILNWFRSIQDEQRVSVGISRQEFQKKSICWKGAELAPMKENLEKLLTDPGYVLTPSCSKSWNDIIDLDPTSETLVKVVFLKTSQLLVFVVRDLDDGEKELVISLGDKLGAVNQIIIKLKRGFDLIAFDERSRFISFYDASISTIKTFRFDEAFRRMDWIGADVALNEYAISRLIWMDFVTDRNEIVFIDDLHRVKLCEVNHPAMVKPGNLHLVGRRFVGACVTSQGSCLLVFRAQGPVHVAHIEQSEYHDRDLPDAEGEDALGEESDVPMEDGHPEVEDGLCDMDTEEKNLTVDIYRLDDGIRHCQSISLGVQDLEKLQFGVVSFASQMHLVMHNSNVPTVLVSNILQISSSSEMCQLQQVTRPEEEAESESTSIIQPGPIVDYVHQIYEKFATSPPLISQSRKLNLRLLLDGNVEQLSGGPCSNSGAMNSLSAECLVYVKSSLDKLKRDKGKDFSALEIDTSVHRIATLNDVHKLWNDRGSFACTEPAVPSEMGDWMRRLVCLVPIQIARAENNSLKPMVNGLQLSSNVDYVDALSLTNVIRFGLYEAVLNKWVGSVKVISSMGKQSSGKSYLLNHLSGSLLDVAGGRCTDGVWMSMRQANECLYVLMDFEGLGSFERSEQEDMLLSILNAAISNLTIFNKKDFHLDKETEAIFERFQNGVSLVKKDEKLFKGMFYMAIKDVDSADVDDLKKEFTSKISQICNKSQDNFLMKMYGGQVEISAMPSFNRPEFHESIGDIGLTVEELDAAYMNGRSFALDLKLIIAQIATKDWSSVDSKRVALRIHLLKQHLKSAVGVGCAFIDGSSKPLVHFDDQVEILDESIHFDGLTFSICDTELELIPFQERTVTRDILLSLMATFKSSAPRKGQKDEEWHSAFERFISALVLRRKERVMQWITANTSDFSNDGDIQKLQLEVVASLAEIHHNLLLCSCKCKRCFLRCVQEKGHPSSHSCMGDHRCVHACTYCSEESMLGTGLACSDAAGHDGPHDCKQRSHTCGKCCALAYVSSNCNKNCSKKSGHSDDHQCNSRQHMCNQICSLPSCKNPCVSLLDLGDHEIHSCREKFCPQQCSLTGCNRTCSSQDHFHGERRGVKNHFCGSEHPCPSRCEQKGNCEVLTEVSKKTQTFTGKRGTFDYELISEQNGNRKDCCIVIPPNKKTHKGSHSHSLKADAVHFCETRCPRCGYFCYRPIGHSGLHNTTHGNMRDVNFVAESEEIDILERKYLWGESGVAELCQMNCKAQGRGHVHLIHCPQNSPGGTCRKLFDGAQHEVRKYGPDVNVPKDEMTHEAYWEYVRFEDPCAPEDRSQFALCSHQCKSDEHIAPSGSGTHASLFVSYCTGKMWHAPISKSDLARFGSGYVTDDGHHFSCDHSKNMATNVIFVIDISGSMGFEDIQPGMTQFSHHRNRLGCVYEAVLRFIRTRVSTVQGDIVSVVLFNSHAETVVNLQGMQDSVVDILLRYGTGSGTTYSSGLINAEEILRQSGKDTNFSRMSTVVIFLSDGGNNGGSDPLMHVRQMKALDPKLQVHTIMFGKDSCRQILIDMAKAGDGTFEVSLDEVQLCRRFEGLAKSIRPKVASLI